MTEWLLTRLSTPALVVLVLGGLTTIAGLGCVLFRRLASQLVDATDDTVAGVVVSILAGIYGIVLAFVIVVLWQGYQDARAVVSDEANALSALARTVDLLTPPQRVPAMSAVGDYVHSVVADEWPAMEHAQSSARTSSALDGLFRVVNSDASTDPSQQALHDRAAVNLDDVASKRRQRISLSEQGLPGVLAGLIVGGALLIVAFTYLFSVRLQSVHLVMSCGVALLLGCNLLLALLLQNPFSGDISVSNHVFRSDALAVYWK
jgi:Protein of unknown function (DUF4239)